MTRMLRIAPTLQLPVDAVTKTFGVLAKRRVGKTYTASVVAEEFAAAKVPFVALDPMGAWWGLRSSADGLKPGIPVVILGGAHGDVGLERGGGKLVADLVVDNPGFYVLDLEGFDSNAAQVSFVTAFAERLYRRKATKRDPLHLFIDEADSFVPQRPQRGEETMLGAFESIVRRGGIRGLGTTLISQRAAVVNKNVLTQLDALIILQVTGPQDQDAIRDWVKHHATRDELTQLNASMASLGRGEAWVYAPGWLDVFRRVTIRERRTFNSSATPEMGETITQPSRLADVDLEAVRKAMAATIEKAAANDPVALHARIARAGDRIRELEMRLSLQKPETIEKTVYKEIEKPILTDRQVGRLTRAAEAVAMAAASLDTTAQAIAAAVKTAMAEVPPQPAPAAPAVAVQRPPTPRPAAPDGRAAESGTDGAATMRAGARKMLDVLARSYPLRLTKAQLGTLAGMAHTGGTFGNYLSTMKRLGYVEVDGDALVITNAGLAVAGVAPGNPLTAEEVREQWRGSLRAGARTMFDVLVYAYPDGLTKEQLGEQIGNAFKGGTFGNYLSTLRRNGLVVVEAGVIKATPVALGQL